MTTNHIKCIECGRWYEVFTAYCGDQDLCPVCLQKRAKQIAEDRKSIDEDLRKQYESGKAKV